MSTIIYGPHCHHDECGWHACNHTGEQWRHVAHGMAEWLTKRYGTIEPKLLREVELVWATTWQDDANKMISPVLGPPELPVIRFDRHHGTIKAGSTQQWSTTPLAALSHGSTMSSATCGACMS